MTSRLSSPRATVEQLLALATATARASRAYRASPIGIVRRARRARSVGGYEYDEALRVGLLAPRAPSDAYSLRTSKHATLEAQRRINHEALSSLTEEKAIFYRLLEALELPAPRLFGIIGPGTGWGRGVGVVADRATFERWLEGLPGDLVVKPSAGVHGKGVRVIRREGGRLVAIGEGPISPGELHEAMTTDPDYALWVVQERLRNSPEVARLGSSETLQTTRIVTVVHPDGSTSVVQCLLKLAAEGAAIDNYRGGGTGNCLVDVDPDGRLGPVRSVRGDGCGYLLTPDMPGTGRRVEGEVLPGWGEALTLARTAARLFLPARTIGWDVALTTDGPKLIEGNMWWDPPGTLDHAGALARLAQPGAEGGPPVPAAA